MGMKELGMSNGKWGMMDQIPPVFQTIDKPYIQERMQGFLYERRNSNEATSLLMF